MKRFFRIWSPILPYSIGLLFSFAKIVAFLKLESLIGQLVVYMVALALFVIAQYFLVARRFKTFERFQKTKHRFLDRQSDILLPLYKTATGYELRINVMIPSFKLLTRSEPRTNNPDKKTFAIARKQFYSTWVSKNMEHDPDRAVQLTTKQGVCGEAYREKGICLADLTVKNPATYNLSRDQLRMTKDIKFVLSCPIRELDHENLRLTDKVLGVVNFDSKSPGSEYLINNQRKLEDLHDRIKGFSELCSLLF